jgi:hypothetical protein
MLLKGNKLEVKKPFQGFKEGDVLTIDEIAALEMERDGEPLGACIKFEESNEKFPISIYEDGYIGETQQTTEEILNWFK